MPIKRMLGLSAAFLCLFPLFVGFHRQGLIAATVGGE